MVSSRAVTAAVGLSVSLGISAVLWWVFETVLVFLVVPFVPLLLRDNERRIKECPNCSFRTRHSESEFCPRDGHRLD
jgi:hypothetical protein